jgi:two-component system chemotaxis response regulator CheB
MALRVLLEQGGSLEVVGISPSGEHALQSVKRLGPELVVMDLKLPGMNGLEATKAIMRANPVPILVLGSSAERGSRDAAAALAAGAVDALSRRAVALSDVRSPAAAALRCRVRRLAGARVARPAPPAATTRGPSPCAGTRTARAVGIGASTGGPKAVLTVLAGLPTDFRLPVLVVQHIGADSLDALVHWLDGEIDLPVRLAQHGSVAGPGVWVAPNGAHLTVDRSLRVVLDRETRMGPHRPSVDMLLESMARSLGSEAASVVLTGMGTDGGRGTAAVIAGGGLGIAQDEASCVLFGMPRAAAEGGAQLVLPLAEIPAALCRLRGPGQSR